jgi:Tfp pilus assembly protein PilN
VKAVNLIPKDARRGRGPTAGFGVSPAYVVLGLLAVVLVFVVVYVMTSNTISDRKQQLANVQAQLTAQQAVAARLAKYVQFESLAQTRVQTVREIASARFDWYRALSDLSKVVPADTSLQSLTGTVAPGASAGGTSGGGNASGLRSDIAVPAFELVGCTNTQDDVARLMSRLRVINGVTRVTLGNSQKPGANGPGVGSASGGCGANGPSFDLIVFFQSLPGAGPTGVSSVSAPATGASASPASTTTPPATTATTTTATATTATATTATATTATTPTATPAPSTTATTATATPAGGGSK